MNFNLSNNVILITGASKGIGMSISNKLAENGARVVLLSRNSQKLKEINQKFINDGFQSIYKSVDVTNINDLIESVDYAKKTWGTVDGIVNNAGITDDNLIARMKPESFDKVVDVLWAACNN